MTDLFPTLQLSPLASEIKRYLLYLNEHGQPPIKNEELVVMMNTALRARGEKGNVDDRAIRAAATELTFANVWIVNDQKHGYKITTDKKEMQAQNKRDRKAALSLLMKTTARTRAVEHDENYSLEDEYNLMVQEQLAETAEGLK